MAKHYPEVDPNWSALGLRSLFQGVAMLPNNVLSFIPVRALNQVTYCQRLYYLQYVDCVMPTNEHVEGGLHDHRRVDDPALAGANFSDAIGHG